jgi:hypothetical protein
MMMGEKHPSYGTKRDGQLVQPLHRASAGVKNELMASHFDQRARSEAIESGRWRAGA